MKYSSTVFLCIIAGNENNDINIQLDLRVGKFCNLLNVHYVYRDQMARRRSSSELLKKTCILKNLGRRDANNEDKYQKIW